VKGEILLMGDNERVNIFGGKSEATVKYESGPKAYWLRHSNDEKKWVTISAQIHQFSVINNTI
jgi:hypothetical protein